MGGGCQHDDPFGIPNYQEAWYARDPEKDHTFDNLSHGSKVWAGLRKSPARLSCRCKPHGLGCKGLVFTV